MCKHCNIKPVWKFTNKTQLCRSCFIDYFERKVFYTIRKFHLIIKDDKIAVENNNSLENNVLLTVLKHFRDKFPLIELIEIKNMFSNKNNRTKIKTAKLAVPSCLDNEAEEIIFNLISKDINELAKLGSITKIKKNNKIITAIKPLYFLSNREIELYAKLTNISGKKKEDNQDKLRFEIKDFLDDIEKKSPEVRNAIVKSYLELMDLIKEKYL